MAATAPAAAHMADVSWKMLELRARSKRSGSIYEPLKSINLPKPEGGSLWDKLDHYYRIVKSTLLLHQSPTTGLFPTKTYGDNRKAKVHDSLYCAACAWALALAYRRIDDDKGRTHELEHSAIKCMRGILYCYMRQADKVQQFKQDPKPSECLHSVFSAHTGDEVFSHEEYGHLQLSPSHKCECTFPSVISKSQKIEPFNLGGDNSKESDRDGSVGKNEIYSTVGLLLLLYLVLFKLYEEIGVSGL